MLTVRIQEKNHSESIMVLKLKDGFGPGFHIGCFLSGQSRTRRCAALNCYGFNLRNLQKVKKSLDFFPYSCYLTFRVKW